MVILFRLPLVREDWMPRLVRLISLKELAETVRLVRVPLVRTDWMPRLKSLIPLKELAKTVRLVRLPPLSATPMPMPLLFILLKEQSDMSIWVRVPLLRTIRMPRPPTFILLKLLLLMVTVPDGLIKLMPLVSLRLVTKLFWLATKLLIPIPVIPFPLMKFTGMEKPDTVLLLASKTTSPSVLVMVGKVEACGGMVILPSVVEMGCLTDAPRKSCSFC